MNDELQHRLIELETRLAFQEHALSELSDALAASRDESSRNALQLHRVLEELRLLRAGMASDLTGDSASEPPPPHY